MLFGKTSGAAKAPGLRDALANPAPRPTEETVWTTYYRNTGARRP